ncbi:MAG TPA: rRNA methyltransferase, partial [Archangium sp.]
MSSPINLKDLDFDGFGAALAPTGLNRVEHLKLFAAVFSHGAQVMEDLKSAPQVRAPVRDWVQANGALPKLTVVERR